MRIDKYWKWATVGLLAMMMFMTMGSSLKSFAMTDTQPFKAQAQTQTLTSPNKIIIRDDQDNSQSAQTGGVGQTNGQTGTSQTGGGQTDASQAGGGQTVQPKVKIEAFGAVSTPKTDPSTLFGKGRLTMYANHDTAAQLLSVIIETGEGGLIVVDGGWTDNGEFLFNQVKQKGGHVQAWLITHPDSDHAGAIADILYKHHGEITIDGIYYSFFDDSWYQQKDPEVAKMVGYIRGAFDLVPPETLHGDIVSGQVIDAGPAKIQVLNKAYDTNSDFINNSSVTYLVSLNGTNTVFLGDLGVAGGEKLLADHDLGALKCDIVQLAHHGQNGVDFDVYKALKPKIALWPTPQWLWDNDDGGGPGSGPWLTAQTKNWMVRLGIQKNYCIKDGDQVIE